MASSRNFRTKFCALNDFTWSRSSIRLFHFSFFITWVLSSCLHIAVRMWLSEWGKSSAYLEKSLKKSFFRKKKSDFYAMIDKVSVSFCYQLWSVISSIFKYCAGAEHTPWRIEESQLLYKDVRSHVKQSWTRKITISL